MADKLTLAEWESRVGWLPPLIDHLAYDLSQEGRAPANAVAEAVRTLDHVARRGQTGSGKKVGYRTQHAAQAALQEWEIEAIMRTARPIKDAMTESRLAALAEATDSRSLPDLPNKPGKTNWVEKAGGLPSYIERVAKHLHSERGYDTSRSIATAVNWVKKVCATGRTFGGKTQVNAKARAEACNAVRQWEQKRGKSRAKSAAKNVSEAGLIRAVERLKHVIEPIQDQPTFAIRYANRLSVVLGLQAALRDRAPLAVRSARTLLEADESVSIKDLIDELGERQVLLMTLVEALGYGTTPIRARTSEGHKGKFHGMHGTERAVRHRDLVKDDGEREEVAALVARDKNGSRRESDLGPDDAASRTDEERAEHVAELIREAAPTLAPPSSSGAAWSEGLHPRAPAGQFASKGGAQQGQQGQAQGQGAAKPAGPDPAAVAAAIRSNDPEFQKQMAATAEYARTHPEGTAQQTTQLAGDQVQAIGYANDPGGISQFQKDYGLSVTGKLDDTTLATIQTVYANNARTSASKVPDFSGIAGAGARVTSRSKTKAPHKTSAAKPKKLAAGYADGGEFHTDKPTLLQEDAILFQTRSGSPILVGPPSGTNHANEGPEGGPETRQPGGDDFNFDEPPRLPPNLRERDGNHACASCVHFSPKGWVTSANIRGGCMLWTWPVDRLDVCDDWLTLTPPDAPLRVQEARLAVATELGDADEIIAARAVVKMLRAKGENVVELPHVASRALADAVEEGTLTTAKRKKLPKSSFAIPESQSYPIHDESHARNALSRVAQHGSPEEKARVRAAVKRRYPHIGSE